MKRGHIIVIAGIVFALVCVATFLYTIQPYYGPTFLRGEYHPEKLDLLSTYVNGTSDTVFADVKLIESDHVVNINSAIIKDIAGIDVASINLVNVNLREGQSTTIRINLNCTLPSGQYILNLKTSAGGSFISPVFAIGE